MAKGKGKAGLTKQTKQQKSKLKQHFVGGIGPTDAFPDPIPADGSPVTPTRPPPKRRRLYSPQRASMMEISQTVLYENENTNYASTDTGSLPSTFDSSCRTDEDLPDSTKDRLSELEEEKRKLQEDLIKRDSEIQSLKTTLNQYEKKILQQQQFSADGIRNREKN